MKSLSDIVNGLEYMNWGDVAFKTLMGLCITATTVAGGAQIYLIATQKPKPDRYIDLNNDGISDKIVSERVKKQGLLWSQFHVYEDKVLYGLEVNGKKFYLPKEQFEQVNK